MNEVRFTLTENARLAPNVYRLRLAGDASTITAPGQFLELSIPGFFLRRPLSVCDWEDGSVTILYRAVGDGTRALAEMKPGQTIDALCGLGNGFDVTACGEKTLVIGGGIGVPPMYSLAKRLLAAGKTPAAILGFNTASEIFYKEEFEALGIETILATADGSVGSKGFVTDALPEAFDTFCACGPMPMLRAIRQYAIEHDIPAYISLEERMACGVGACLGCVCKTTHKDAHSHVNNARICTDGPVFEAREVEI